MENQDKKMATLFREALVDPRLLSDGDFAMLLAKYPYSQPLYFAKERRKFLNSQLNSLDHRAVLLAPSASWLYDYVQKSIDDVSEETFSFTEKEGERQKESVTLESRTKEPISNLPIDFEDLEVEDEDETLENLVKVGIGGGDFFAIHDKERKEEVVTEIEASDEDVSLYNDELMPYSFRWWLQKTRMAYADTYQPFVEFSLPVAQKIDSRRNGLDEGILDQQIRENIIHLQPPEDKLSDEVKQKDVLYTRVDKTAKVIEKFILEEPQIQPPQADQLNTENKARKSSEEQFNLVTETLATIYANQTMYVKAIEVYKKLILKFPEKKSYFASRIKKLEEKLY